MYHYFNTLIDVPIAPIGHSVLRTKCLPTPKKNIFLTSVYQKYQKILKKY
jgi:hypothetical protein